MFKIITSFIITLFAQLHVMVSTILTCGKQLHDRIISLRGKIWTYETTITPPLFIEVRDVSNHVNKGLMCSEYNSDCNKYSYYCQHCICALLEVHDHILK